MIIYAIIPARSGSKGLKNKNIRKLCGHELIGYSISFAEKLGVDRVFCSTDSPEYAEIAIKYGAEVPFLRGVDSSGDKAMENTILGDLYQQFQRYTIPIPDLIVWLRPTFVFRDLESVYECIRRMKLDPEMTACRVVVPAESRLYRIKGGYLKASFPTGGKSMIRRQDIEIGYRVFCTDVFRGGISSEGFLGNRVGAVIGQKICGVDIDDEFDFMSAEAIVKYLGSELGVYLHLQPKI